MAPRWQLRGTAGLSGVFAKQSSKFMEITPAVYAQTAPWLFSDTALGYYSPCMELVVVLFFFFATTTRSCQAACYLGLQR